MLCLSVRVSWPPPLLLRPGPPPPSASVPPPPPHSLFDLGPRRRRCLSRASRARRGAHSVCGGGPAARRRAKRALRERRPPAAERGGEAARAGAKDGGTVLWRSSTFGRRTDGLRWPGWASTCVWAWAPYQGGGGARGGERRLLVARAPPRHATPRGRGTRAFSLSSRPRGRWRGASPRWRLLRGGPHRGCPLWPFS